VAKAIAGYYENDGKCAGIDNKWYDQV